MTTRNASRIGAADAPTSRDAAVWLGLAASPTFGLMAWISARGGEAMTCAPTPGGWPIDGMAWMYLLMSVFHLAPWLKLAAGFSSQKTKGD